MAMALLHPPKLLIILIFFLVINCIVMTMMVSHSDAAQIDDTSSSSINLITEALNYNWPSALYDEDDDDDDEFGHIDVGVDDIGGRRSLFWRRLRRYYISYGALFANRIPCPPRSGRSYYTHNCNKASGPVHPYTRGCSAITRCRT